MRRSHPFLLAVATAAVAATVAASPAAASPAASAVVPAAASAAPVALAGPAADSPGPDAPSARIIGGETVTTPVPWAAALKICTATLIAPEWVLTAAHCFMGAEIDIAVGEADKSKGRIVRTAAAFNGGVGTDTRDLLLYKLAAPVPGATPVKLATADPAVGAEVEVFGWGLTCPTCGGTSVMKTATMKVVKTDGQDYKRGPALGSERGTGTVAKGDSGGPMFHRGELVGVTSMDYQGLAWHASVARNRAWIRGITGF